MMGGGEVFAGVTEKKEIAAGLGDGGNSRDALLISPEEPFIIVMAADPEPCHGIVVHDAYGPVSQRHPH